ncbi:transcriptional activator somA-like [Phacochoerus africanus]|uniref:transcriptional activator somA-like n=1 Tax=Phacochoerus africanus TaxID=41426 RepID=UPI001FD9AE29|nr:transcriptional activator somA-like [Phacochoerus africanus]
MGTSSVKGLKTSQNECRSVKSQKVKELPSGCGWLSATPYPMGYTTAMLLKVCRCITLKASSADTDLPQFLSRAVGRSLLGIQNRCNSSREVVSNSPRPSRVKFRSHSNHLIVDLQTQLSAWLGLPRPQLLEPGPAEDALLAPGTGAHGALPQADAWARPPGTPPASDTQLPPLTPNSGVPRASPSLPGHRLLGPRPPAPALRRGAAVARERGDALSRAGGVTLGTRAAAGGSVRGGTRLAWRKGSPGVIRRGRHRPGPSAGSSPSRALLAPGTVNGKMEMDVEGVSPREDPIPRSQGAGGACQAPPQPPQPQPQPPPPPQQPAPDEPPGESAGTEDSDDPDPEARPDSEKGESKRDHGLRGDVYPDALMTASQRFHAASCSGLKPPSRRGGRRQAWRRLRFLAEDGPTFSGVLGSNEAPRGGCWSHDRAQQLEPRNAQSGTQTQHPSDRSSLSRSS